MIFKVYYGTDLELSEFLNKYVMNETQYFFEGNINAAKRNGKNIFEVTLSISNILDFEKDEDIAIIRNCFFKGKDWKEDYVLTKKFKSWAVGNGYEGIIYSCNNKKRIILFSRKSIHGFKIIN